MLTADEIESLPIGLEKQFRQLEKRIMRDIIRRLKNAEEITRTADWQIYRASELGKAADDIKKEITETLGASEDEVNKIYTDAAKTDWARSKKLYKSVGQAAIAYKDNEPLKQLVAAIKKQTADELRNITRTLGVATANKGKIKTVSLTEYYTDMLDAAVLDISSGAFDYNTVLQHTVTQLANSGIRTINYDSVSKRPTSARIDVAARRAVMTGIGQLTAQVSEDNANALGTDMYEVSAHSCCRPEHVEWQGGWYTMAQLKSVCGYGKVDGLKGANCGHDFYPVIPGVSEPSYTPEELKQMKADEAEEHEYKGKKYTKYEASQKQRRLERTVAARYHAVDLLKEGGADEKAIQDAKISYQAVSQEYTRFSKAMGLTPQRERINLALGGMEGRSNPAPKPGKTDVNPVEIPLDKSEKSGIIDTRRESDLGYMKKRLQNDKAVSEEYYSTIKDKFAHGSDDAKHTFAKLVPDNSVGNGKYAYTPYYDPVAKKIYMNYDVDVSGKNERGGGVTWFHEHGHMVDDLAGQVSKDPDFFKLLESDYHDYMMSYGKAHSLNTFLKVQQAIGRDLKNMREHSAVSDILGAISKGNIRGIAGHAADYWKDDSVITAEAFAHMFEAQFDETRYKEMKKYFPNALKKFESMLGGVAKK